MKKNLIIATLVVGAAGLAVEYINLMKDFKHLIQIHETNKELVGLAKKVVTDQIFYDIVKNYDN